MAFMGSDEADMPIPAFKPSSGGYHLEGCLEATPVSVLSYSPASCLQLRRQGRGPVGMRPANASTTWRCFSDAKHLTNLGEAEFNILKEGIATGKHTLYRDRATRYSLLSISKNL